MGMSGSASPRGRERLGWPSLVRQPYLPYQLNKSRIGTQGIECEFGLQAYQPPFVFLISDVEPPESLIIVSQVRIKSGNKECRPVTSLTSRLQRLYSFGLSGLPSS